MNNILGIDYRLCLIGLNLLIGLILIVWACRINKELKSNADANDDKFDNASFHTAWGLSMAVGVTFVGVLILAIPMFGYAITEGPSFLDSSRISFPWGIYALWVIGLVVAFVQNLIKADNKGALI